MNKFERMIQLDEALRAVDECLSGRKPDGETIAVREAIGRTVLTDQKSRIDLPPFDKSAMDGYAIAQGEEREEYRLIETIPAGQAETTALVPGTAAKVMTGAQVPEGTARVVMVEHTEEHEGTVRVLKHDSKTNICRRGEDVRAGDVILPAGAVLGPVELANLIACGISEVEVARKVRVAIISTGDEIVNSADLLSAGKIMDSNGPMLSAMSEQFGMTVAREETVPDEKEATEQAIRHGLSQADIVILTGGVSVGDFDYVLGALADIGLTIRFSRVAIQPGKPTVFADGERKAVFGLPGNPVSAFLMFHLFVLRAADWMSGRLPGFRTIRLPLAVDFRRRNADRLSFVPVKLTDSGGVERVEFHGSAHLLALASADGFALIPIGVSSLRAGDTVDFLRIPRCAGW